MAYQLFVATDKTTANHGTEPWTSDGTAAGTKELKDIAPGPASSSPADLTYNATTTLSFFTANDGSVGDGTQLWATTGAPGNATRLDKLGTPGNPAYSVDPATPITAVFGTKWNVFVATDKTAANHGTELWTTDGTAANTSELADIAPGAASSNPADFQVNPFTKVFLFTANDGSNGDGTQVYLTNGVTVTRLDANATPGTPSYAVDPNTPITPVPGANYDVFVATDKTAANHGTELWVTNTTAAGTKELMDIAPGAGNSNPANFTSNATSGKVFFTAKDGSNGDGTQLYATDGLTVTWLDPKQTHGSPSYGGPTDVTTLTGTAYELFVATDKTTANHGTELWSTDGTAANTKELKDIAPGAAGSGPTDITVNTFSKIAYFTANDGSTGDGRQLYLTDGTTVTRLDPGTAGNPSYAVNSLTPITPVPGANYAVFVATDKTAANHGTELWTTNNTAGGTKELADIAPGSAGSNPADFVANAFTKVVYFTANDGSLGDGTQLYATDGTTVTRLDKAASGTPSYSVDPNTPITPLAGTKYAVFVATDKTAANHGSELWVTDGTAAGTKELADIAPGSAGSSPNNFTYNAGLGKVFFTANDGSLGDG